jgi:two-component system sensor histidine kinase/response regulator
MPSDENLLDYNTLLAACGGDPILLQKMIDSFQSRAPDLLSAIRAAAQRQDAKAFRRAGHHLRGLISTFSTSIATEVVTMECLGLEQPIDTVLSRCETVAQRARDLSRLLSGLTIEELRRASAV